MATRKSPKKKAAAKKKAVKKKASKKAASSKKATSKKKAAAKKKAGKSSADSGRAPAKKSAAKKKKVAAATKSPSGKATAKPETPDASATAAPEATLSEPRKPSGAFSSTNVNLGHVFALRPRVPTSFRQPDFVRARQLLEGEAFQSLEDAARAVADKALELTRGGPLGRGGRKQDRH